MIHVEGGVVFNCGICQKWPMHAQCLYFEVPREMKAIKICAINIYNAGSSKKKLIANPAHSRKIKNKCIFGYRVAPPECR